MLALKSARPALCRARPRRTYFTSTIQSLSDGVLDLAIALPYPESLPVYSTTIIAVTVASRLVLTVPFSIWAKRLQWKTEDVVVPKMKQLGPQIADTVRKQMAKEGVTGTKDQLKAMHLERTQAALKVERKKLLSENKVSPMMIMAIPALTQLPVFVFSSMVFARIAQAPSVLDSESFWTLTSLVNPDPTATIPVVIGLITLANVESSRWFMSAEQQARQEKVEKWNADKRAQGHTVIEPKKIIQNGLRFLSVGRILVAAMVPGAVEIYWLASASFGLLQSWAFDWWEHRRSKASAAAAAIKAAATTKSSKPLRII